MRKFYQDQPKFIDCEPFHFQDLFSYSDNCLLNNFHDVLDGRIGIELADSSPN